MQIIVDKMPTRVMLGTKVASARALLSSGVVRSSRGVLLAIILINGQLLTGEGLLGNCHK
jgi:hypothetical protein